MEKNIYQEIKGLKTFEEVEAFKSSVDEAINEQIEQIKKNVFINEIKNKGFGYIKENFENLSEELFKTKKGRVIINSYVSCIKENKDLAKMHQMYECIRKADKEGSIDSYLMEAVSLIGNIDKKQYKKSLDKLGDVFAKAYTELCEGRTNDDLQLMLTNNGAFDKSVEFIMLNKKTPSNLAEYNSKLSTIKKQIVEGKGYTFSESKNLDTMVDEMVENFNKKYAGQLDSEVVGLVKEMFEGKDKEVIFNRYKEQCINKLNETKKGFEDNGDDSSSKRISTIIERIDKKVYNPDTVNNDLYNLIEISSIE